MNRPSLLLIDDDTKLLTLLSRYLTRYGYDVMDTNSPNSGLAIFHRNKFDLIILDKMMPEINGIELCKKIRAQSDVPVIILSADETIQAQDEARSAGATLFVSKPFPPALLIANLSILLREHNLEEHLQGMKNLSK